MEPQSHENGTSATGLLTSDHPLLLRTASEAVAYGLSHGRAMTPRTDGLPGRLIVPRATFVTLQLAGRLRGCIGTLIAARPLIQDIAWNAFAAAFRDPRFPPVNVGELVLLNYHISVLSPPEPMTFQDEADLLSQMRPGVDGLLLTDREHRGTFLPSVWEQLPDPLTFLQHLKRKAGLPVDHWSDTLKVERYTAESIPAEH